MGNKNIKEGILGGLVKRKKLSSLRFIILFLIGITILNFGISEINADSYENLDLRNNIISIETTKAGNGFEDLEPLKEILKDKKIVAMGEATHGTKEFFEMKHRMFEFLVEEMGYRAFAIEAEFGGAQEVNDYILNGTGSAYDAVDTLLQLVVWETEEVLQMVEWMRNYNRNSNNKEKIRFYGFDMQSGVKDVDKVLAYLEKVDQEIDSKYTYNLGLIRRSANVSVDIIKKLKMIFDENKQMYIAKTSTLEYERIYQHLEIISQWMELKNITGVDYANKRDKYMAENVEWIYDYEKNFGNDKIMLWAHNGHISKKFINYKSMGEHLKEIYGDMLYVIGFDFYKGSFMAFPGNMLLKAISNKMASFTIEKGDSRTFAAAFEKTGIPLSFMDFKLASKEPEIADWLAEEQYIRSIGGVYFGRYIFSCAPEIPIESYDGLIFIGETTASERMNKEEEIISNGDRYLTIYYIMRIFILVLILFFTVRFIIRKRKRRSINQ